MGRIGRIGAALALVSGMLCIVPMQARAVSWMGYYNFEYLNSKVDQKRGWMDIHHVSLILQHEISVFKFFNELEFEHVGDGVLLEDGAGNGDIVIERAWAQVDGGEHFRLKLGKELVPTVWWIYHYPNLSMQVSRPLMMKKIFRFQNTGLLASGDILAGFTYDAWVSNSNLTATNETDRELDYGGKLSWAGELPEGQLSLGVLAGHYNDADRKRNPWGFDANVSWENFLLWAEYHKNETRKGYYGVLSYGLPAGAEGVLSPFVFHDSYTDEADSATRGEAKKRLAVGVNYKPIPTIALKSELIRTFKAGNSVQETGLNLGFVYFFN
ncbi:MAG: hypothetical protein NDJ89_17135 [Oligoflexia bacterium]|nr:hypothetical protein [Oligoflexia bacterium]